MTHYAVVAPPHASHVRAIGALVRPLLDGDHRVSWLAPADVRPLVADARIGFVPVGAATHPPGSLAAVHARAAAPGSPWGLQRVIRDMADATRMYAAELPAQLERLGVDAVLADQMEAGGALAARRLGLPWAGLACALPVQRVPGVPLAVMPWGPARSPRSLQVLRESERVHDWLMAPLHDTIAREAARCGWTGVRTLAELAGGAVLHLAQTTPAFELPSPDAAAAAATGGPPVHALGPWRLPGAAATGVPWPHPAWRDPVRPLAFASLGTLQGGRLGLWRRIVRACVAEDLQLVVAHCGGLDAAQAAQLRSLGAAWVTDFVPQQALLAQADLLVTHGGLNTVMDGLAAGLPMAVLPLGFDQPGVAARVVHAGAGLRLWPQLASVGALRRAVRRLLAEPTFRVASRRLGAGIAGAGGATRGAALLTAALAARTPSPLEATA